MFKTLHFSYPTPGGGIGGKPPPIRFFMACLCRSDISCSRSIIRVTSLAYRRHEDTIYLILEKIPLPGTYGVRKVKIFYALTSIFFKKK